MSLTEPCSHFRDHDGECINCGDVAPARTIAHSFTNAEAIERHRAHLRQERDRLTAAREAVARWLCEDDGDGNTPAGFMQSADALLSLPEVQALIGGQPLSRSALTVTV